MCVTKVNSSVLSGKTSFRFQSRGNAGRLNPITNAPEDGQRGACLKEIKASAAIPGRVAVMPGVVCGRLNLAATVTKCS
jgi:hypothetical protein